MKSLECHPNIVQIIEFGDNGQVSKLNGKKNVNVVFIVLEFVAGGLLYDVVETLGSLNEDYSRFFFK